MKRLVLCVGFLLFILCGLAEATLHDRGGGLVYDDVLDVTWLKNANYVGQRMTLHEALTWVQNFEYYDSIRDVTWADWRLPNTLPVNGSSYVFTWATDGSTDKGYNISGTGTIFEGSTASEMAYMYYNNLGNLGRYDTEGNARSDGTWGLKNTGPFVGLQGDDYCSGTENISNPDIALNFTFSTGNQQNVDLDGVYYVWPVRDGDVIQTQSTDICDCVITPSKMTVTRGAKLEFDITVTNNTDIFGTAKFGGKITKPDLTTTGFVYGPQEFVLQAHGQKQAHITHDIPTSWPVGRYTYHGYVGNQGILYGECEFDFIVPADVPKTGQTLCYPEGIGGPIPCEGTGQDGELRKGTPWPAPRYTKNNNGTVTDNMTGLVWLENANCFPTVTWTDALTICNSLADSQYALTDGSSAGDWRLPNIREMLSLIDYAHRYPALSNTDGIGQWTQGNPFTWTGGTFPAYPERVGYWTNTTKRGNGEHAWYVHLEGGQVGYGHKWEPAEISFWPVRDLRPDEQ